MNRRYLLVVLLLAAVSLVTASGIFLYRSTSSAAQHNASVLNDATPTPQPETAEPQVPPAVTPPKTATTPSPPATKDTTPGVPPQQPGAQNTQPLVKPRDGSAPNPGTAGRPNGMMRDHPRNFPGRGAFALIRLFRGIGWLAADDSKTPLSPDQAKAILAIMTPLRSQPTLTPEQAEQTRKKLETELTSAQKDAIANFHPFGRGGPGGAGQPGGRPPQGQGQPGMRPRPEGRPDGQRPEGAPPPNGGQHEGRRWGGERGPGAPGGPGGPGRPPVMVENWNPFYTKSDSPMTERMAQRWQAIFDALEARAK